MARVPYHKINREYIVDAFTLHLLVPLATVLTHPGKAQMWAFTLQVVQLGLRDMDLHCVCTRSWCGDHRHQRRHSPASMGDPGEQGAEPLDLVCGESPDSSHGENGGADGLFAPVTVVSEPEQGLSKANSADSSMIDSQFQERRRRSICGLALASSPRVHPPAHFSLTPYGLCMLTHAGGI